MTTDGESAGQLVHRVMHIAYWVLLLVGYWVSLGEGSYRPATAALGALATAYLLGLNWQRHHPGRRRDPRAGLVWAGVLVLTWAVACLVGAGYIWLAFPLFFLVLFVTGPPVSYPLLGAMVAWCAALPLLRGQQWVLGSVLGPALGAVVAAGVHWTVGRLRADALDKAAIRERERLAAEVHDTIAQGLNAIVLLARQGDASLLPEIERTARENLAVARDIVGSGDEGASVPVRVKATAAAAQRQARALGQPLAVEFRQEGTSQLLVNEAAQLVVLAAGSLLSNVVRHAQASRCVVSLALLDDTTTLDVADDGCGFDPEAADGYGLRGLRRRVEALGGTMDVDSAPGEGTTVGIALPGGGQ